MAVVLLRFYRAQLERLRQLEAMPDKEASDLDEMDRISKLFAEDEPEPTFCQRLEAAWRGTLTTSTDPIWDQWIANVQSGNIPDEWYGPLKDGVKG